MIAHDVVVTSSVPSYAVATVPTERSTTLFAQVLTFKVADSPALFDAFDTWNKEIGSKAPGFLGGSGGITDDGTAVVIVRYRTAEECLAVRELPEHQQWRADSLPLIAGEIVSKDSVNVITDLPGNPEEAGFVQVIQGRLSDPEDAFGLGAEDRKALAEARPDIIGRELILHDNSEFTLVVSFTNEEQARIGEQQPLPDDVAAQRDRVFSGPDGVPTFYDLRKPAFYEGSGR
jgi:hypothetical protein